MYRITILTCQERKEYLKSTLISLEKAGALEINAERIIYVDGPIDTYEPINGWIIKSLSPGRLGTKEALLTIMKTAAVDEVSKLYYFEDDIVLAKNTLHVMHKLEVPSHLAFIAFCDLKDIGHRFGIAEAPGYDYDAPPKEGGHWGNQALVVPLRSLKLLIDREPPEWAADFFSDVYISVVMATSPSPSTSYGVFYPSLVQHVGEVSLVTEGANLIGWGRSTISFVGENFDANTLDINNMNTYTGKIWSRLSREAKLRLRLRPITVPARIKL